MLSIKSNSKLHFKIPYLISISQFLEILRKKFYSPRTHYSITFFNNYLNIARQNVYTSLLLSHFGFPGCHFIILLLSPNLYLTNPWEPHSCVTCFWRHVSGSLLPGGRYHSSLLLNHFFPLTLPKPPPPLRIQGIRQLFLCDKIY